MQKWKRHSSLKLCLFLLTWCRRGDSNPYRDYSPLDPESSASTNSATSAYFIENNNPLFYILGSKVK